MFGTNMSGVFLLPLVLLVFVLIILAILMPSFIYHIKVLLEKNHDQNKEISNILRDISKQQMSHKAIDLFGGNNGK